MPKIALKKVEKKIRRKKGSLDGLGDRNAARYNRAALRDQKLKAAAKLRSGLKEHDMLRIGFFKVGTKDATEALDLATVRDLIERWVHRGDGELERYESTRRPGRPPAPKHMVLKNRVESEIEEYTTGFLIPDVLDWENIVNLKRWDGKSGSLAQVKFTRIPRENPPEVDKMEM